jgi:hypothetical protein
MSTEPALVAPVQQDITKLETWVLHDGRTGHFNQSMGVAAALGIKTPQVVELKPKPGHGLLRVLWPPLAWQIPPGPYPDLLIATGWQASYIARAIKRRSPATFAVQMMRPSGRLQEYDVVAMPRHNHPPALDHVVATIGAPNRITPARLKQEAARWEKRLAGCPAPRLAVLVGGEAQRFHFGLPEARQLVEEVRTFAEKYGLSLLVTVSRRTGAEVTNYLRNALLASDVPHYFWSGDDPDQRDNPYIAYLEMADAVVVTAESVSMTSEACTAGKPVYVWGLERLKRKKFQRYYDVLLQQKRVAPFTGRLSLRPPQNPLSDTAQVAGFIRGRLARRP